MWRFFSILILVIVCFYQAWAVQPDCVNLSDVNGNITGIYPGNRYKEEFKCWNILNPYNLLLELEMKQLDFLSWENTQFIYLTIAADRTEENFELSSKEDEGKRITVYSNVTVTLYVYNGLNFPSNRQVFELHYNIDDSVKGVEGVEKARSRAVDLLTSNWSSWKWIDHIPKAVTALSLAEGPHFGDSNLKDNLMLKQRELQILISLLRNIHLNDQHSTFINSLLSTCHNPRNFYGYNLVNLLKEQVESGNISHPTSYLALCNANETWPDRGYQDLANTYNNTNNIPFRREYEAFAVMALSCEIRRAGNHSISKVQNLLDYYENNIREFKALQKSSGSFGNVHRTALITQALISSGHKQDSDWNFYNAVKVLVEAINAAPTDIISTYLILPLLGERSLTDIAFTNCSSLRNHDDLVAEIHDGYLGQKIKVQYSLFVGDDKDVIYTIVLKVPKNFTAFDVMQLIASKYSKYQFKYEVEFDKIDIYEMVDIPNDPEGRKFWLFYLEKAAFKNQFTYVELGSNRPVLEEGDHIAMWYKTVHSR